jgi:hypothetical protein
MRYSADFAAISIVHFPSFGALRNCNFRAYSRLFGTLGNPRKIPLVVPGTWETLKFLLEIFT